MNYLNPFFQLAALTLLTFYVILLILGRPQLVQRDEYVTDASRELNRVQQEKERNQQLATRRGKVPNSRSVLEPVVHHQKSTTLILKEAGDT